MVQPPVGDYQKGKIVFKERCASCHVMDSDSNKSGPSLQGIVGRKSGISKNFNYAPDTKYRGKRWTEETLYDFLLDPKKFIPGLRFVCPEIKSPRERADLIKYMEVESVKIASSE